MIREVTAGSGVASGAGALHVDHAVQRSQGDVVAPDALQELLAEELARRSLVDFVQRITPTWEAARHLTYLAELLEAVARGDIRKLLISIMPGSGKSTLLTHFVPWWIGRRQQRCIYVSASQLLSERNSRLSRQCIESPRWVFPDVRLSPTTSSQTRWDVVDVDGKPLNAGIHSSSPGSFLAGHRCHIACADDLQDSVLSPGERDSLYEWFRSELFPRIEPGGAIVCTQVRWGLDDLVGRILESADGHTWTHIELPAIAGENDPLGRAPGESLWPKRWPLEELQLKKLGMMSAGNSSRMFETQYNCRPSDPESAMIKKSWIRRVKDLPKEYDLVVAAMDTAASTSISADWTVIVILGTVGSDIYVLDMVRRKVSFPNLVRMAKSICERHRPSRVYIESASSGIDLVATLRAESHLPVVPIKPVGSKLVRVESQLVGVAESGHLILPIENADNTDWLQALESELFSYPGGTKNDDAIDALTLGVAQLTKRRRWAESSSWHYAVVKQTAPRGTNRFTL